MTRASHRWLIAVNRLFPQSWSARRDCSVSIEMTSTAINDQPWLTEEEEGGMGTASLFHALPSWSVLHVCGASKSLTP